MPVKHPNAVRLMLSYNRDATGSVLAAVLEAWASASDVPLFRVEMTPALFARLLASGEVNLRSRVPLPTGPGLLAECQEGDYDRHGDCDGAVREYTVRQDAVCGQTVGEAVLLCASHAAYHGRKIRRAAYAGS